MFIASESIEAIGRRQFLVALLGIPASLMGLEDEKQHLHDYERAISLFDKSLTTYNPTLTPGRARLLARKAEAYYGLGEIDSCVTLAEEALTLAHSVGASNTITRVRDLHVSLTLSPWKKERSVARLGALLVEK